MPILKSDDKRKLFSYLKGKGPRANFIHRMLAAAAGRETVSVGEEITIPVDLALGHDGTADAFLSAWPSGGSVALPARTVFTLDHLLPAPTVPARELHRKLQEFARQHRIQLFSRGEGVLHQVVAERFTPSPGWIIAGADGHVATAGAFGALAFSVSSEDLVPVLLTGKLTLKVPHVYTVEVTGTLSPPVTARDLGLMLLGRLGKGEVKGKAIGLQGKGVWRLTPAGKMSLCNLMGETGAVTGLIIPPDEADKATSADLKVAGETLEPMIACPPSPENVRPLREVVGTPLTQVLVGGCASGRLEDMQELVKGLAGRSVHSDIILLVVPASQDVVHQMEKKGLSRALREQGALLLPPGCGPCPGKHLGLIAKGDRVLTTTVRNTPGRMGSAEGEIYLASPRAAGAAAAAGAVSLFMRKPPASRRGRPASKHINT
ncbi:MAG TPA: aconitase family protein [Nitrospirota bacterium]|nr:aconitase family protein [Nitrospirota bacterium]